ncbi:YhdP family protein [Solimonas marina]|uniref:TIGR02099 family protein n=1 Tax=Solimonas marina TaxID=2714601 RepID=A0A969W9I1_9GAMM|nr:YhdP family protein [Solimonas marina]NKF22842.1 TIGR02099 family protein [Solimonas marina]
MERVKRRWWTWAITLMAAVVIAGAVISGLFQLAVLALPSYRADLAAWVTHVANRPVQIGGVNLGWRGIEPRLDLSDITLYSEDGDESLTVTRLSLGFSVVRLLTGDMLPERLEMSGLTLSINEDRNGQWTFAGFEPGQNGVSDDTREAWAKQMARFGHVVVQNCTLIFTGPRFGIDGKRVRLVRADLAQRSDGFGFDGRLQLPVTHGDLVELSADVQGPIAFPERWNGDFNLDFERLRPQGWLAPYLQPGVQIGAENLNGSIEGELQSGRVTRADVEIDSDGLIVARNGQSSGAKSMRLRAGLTRDASGWFAALEDFRFDDQLLARGSLRWTRDSNGHEIDINADELHVDRLMPWLAVWRDAPAVAAQAPRLSGTLRNIVLRLRTDTQGQTRYSATARLDDMGLAPADGVGVAHVSGEASANEGGGQLRLSHAPIELLAPKAIAVPITFDSVDTQLQWTRTVDGWNIGTPSFEAQLPGVDAKGHFQLALPGDHDAPVLDLGASFSVADLDKLKPYMPLQWSEHTRDWLQQGIAGGHVSNGQLTIRGPMSDFPFQKHPDGVFKIDADVGDANIEIGDGWPTIENVAAHLSVAGAGLEVDASAATIAGNAVDHVVARIADFGAAELTVDGSTHGEIGRYYDFLRNSPLHERLAGLLDQTHAAGAATVDARLDLPLHDIKTTSVDGDIALDNVQMFYSKLDQPVSGITGTVHFNNIGATANELHARFEDLPLTARIVPRDGTHGVVQADFPFTPNAGGRGASQFLPSFIREALDGTSQWHAELPIEEHGGTALTLRSDLRGTAVTLPEPVAKDADVAMPLSVRIGGDADAPLRIGAAYGGMLYADAALGPPDGQQQGLQLQGLQVRFGSASPPAGKGRFVVDGHAGTVDAAAWIALFAGDGQAKTAPPTAPVAAMPSPTAPDAPATTAPAAVSAADPGVHLDLIDLDVDHLRWQNQLTEATHLRWQPQGNGWMTSLDGVGAQGTIQWVGPAPGRIVARLSHVALKPQHRPDDEPIDDSDAAAVAAAAAQASDNGGPPAQPSHWPSLDLLCDALTGNGADFGQVEIRSSRIAQGQRLDRLKISGGVLDLDASGQWRRADGKSSAALQAMIESKDFDAVLGALDYEQNFRAKETKVKADLKWAPSTTGLVWQVAQGRVDLSADNGQLKAVKPGAGRVLGLLNFYALPRRLLLNFSDVVDEGLGFDTIGGHFDLGNGAAVTDDLTIKGPSVKIDMRGRIGLVARDYDQRVTVYPAGISSGVTLGAALLGGPAVGALVLVAQEVLDKPLDQVTQLTYHVSGSWYNPKVEKIDSHSLPKPDKAEPTTPAPAKVESKTQSKAAAKTPAVAPSKAPAAAAAKPVAATPAPGKPAAAANQDKAKAAPPTVTQETNP